jgi:hypothetical protein
MHLIHYHPKHWQISVLGASVSLFKFSMKGNCRVKIGMKKEGRGKKEILKEMWQPDFSYSMTLYWA